MAAQWQLVIKNNSGSSKTVVDLGWVIDNGAAENAHEQFSYPKVSGSDDLRTLVAAGSLVVNDGTNDLSAANGVKYLILGHKKYIEDLIAAEAQARGEADGTLQDNIDTKLALAGGTMSGDINMGAHEVKTTADPSTGDALTRRSWVEARILAVAPKAGVEARTIEALPACVYDNGEDGVGATLTSNDQALPILDGWTPEVGKSILVANQADAKQNGVYVIDVVSDPMDGFFKLTRRTDMDGSPENELMPGTRVTIRQGASWSGFAATLLGIANTPRVTGTDPITFDFVPGSTATAQVQNEVDTMESAIGLNPDGTYVHPTGTMCLDATTSVMDALGALDDAVEIVGTAANNAQGAADEAQGMAQTAQYAADAAQGAADAAQADATAARNELDATQAGAGLGADGSYTAPTSNYLGGATSLMEADVALDEVVKDLVDSVGGILSGTLDNMSVVNGIMYAKDNIRSRWVGQREVFMLGRSGKTKNMFLEIAGVPSNASGIRLTDDRVLTEVSLQLNAVGSCTLHIRKNGSATDIATLVLDNVAGDSLFLNKLVSAGDYLQFFLSATTAVVNPVATVSAAYDGGAL